MSAAFPPGGVAGIVIGVGVLIAALVVYSCTYIVHQVGPRPLASALRLHSLGWRGRCGCAHRPTRAQTEGIIIERFGRFHRVLRPGLNFIVPVMDAPRNFTWRKTFVDINKKVRDETITTSRVDLRESLFVFQRIEIFSKDTVQLEVRRARVRTPRCCH
jgi:hypothetical protein